MEEPLVLVTGATGYLSAQVVKLLQEEGYRVRGTVRSTKNEDKIKYLYNLCPGAKHKLELVEADLLKEDGWDNAVQGCTFVHHIASPLLLVDPKDENDVIKPAVEGTLLVLKACAEAGTVKRVVLTSSTFAVLAKGSNKTPASEKDWADLKFPNLPTYDKSKILAEKAAWNFVEQLPDSDKLELAVVNPAGIMGPALHRTPGASTDGIKRLLEHEVPRIPHFCINIIDVRDVALAHLRCMTVPEAAGHRHILSAQSVWFKELALILEKEFRQYGYKVPTQDLPNIFFSMATLFDKSLKNLKTTCSEPKLFDTTRMSTVLGINPIGHETTLIDMGYSLIDNGFVKKTDQYKPRT